MATLTPRTLQLNTFAWNLKLMKYCERWATQKGDEISNK
jgi:hypothetical protein